MKLKVTARSRNLRTGRTQAWEAATPCGTYTALRVEHADTPWMLSFHMTNQSGSLHQSLGLFGSLRAAQRHVDRIVQAKPQQPTEAPRS